jgi:acyl-CoA synthetase (NDP forming)
VTGTRQKNLKRLFAPQSLAFVGGRSAELAALQCVAGSFEGAIRCVNPRRKEMAGLPCFAHVEDLPEAPDAVFLAVPSTVAVEAVDVLRRRGAGGIVCYTAGFGETGAAGLALERQMVAAAGDMALVGPNCSGMLNYAHKAVLWPFDHGGTTSSEGTGVERGAAFITQSGMLGNTVTMNRRGLPFSHIISSGNQAMLGVEDFLEVLIEDSAVSAIGLYIESLRDVPRFADAALRALEVGKPIVAQKVGTSEIGAQLTVTHTGSLSGAQELYRALFQRFGVISVESPVAMIEALKLATFAGIPKGSRIAGLTCSGGDSTMLADGGAPLELCYPQPSKKVSSRLQELLPPIATVSNPLDYTTPLWGHKEPLVEAFDAFFQEGFDAAIMVQDYPTLVRGTSYEPYLADLRAFAKSIKAAGIPGAVCSILPENLDQEVRATMIELGVAPLQGIDHALEALAGVAGFGALRVKHSGGRDLASLRLLPQRPIHPDKARLLDEWDGKQRLASAGLAVPQGRRCDRSDAPQAAAEIGFPVAVKLLSAELPHKSDAGALCLGLKNEAEVEGAVEAIIARVKEKGIEITEPQFLVERMIKDGVAEVLVGLRHDPLFGPVMVIGSGGLLAELLGDTCVLLLPCSRSDIREALASLKLASVLKGYRGAPAADMDHVVERIFQIARFTQDNLGKVIELDVNPLIATRDDAIAADALLRVAEGC